MKTTSIFVSLITALVLLAGCSEHTPDRDHMPLLRARLFQLQQAVKGGDRAAIDSLMSIRIIDNRQGSDSLLNFIYGADRSLSFDRFDNYDIVYFAPSRRRSVKRYNAGGLPFFYTIGLKPFSVI